MKKRKNLIIVSHISSNRIKYIIALFFLFTGIIIGAVVCSNKIMLKNNDVSLTNFFYDHQRHAPSLLSYLHIFIINIRPFILLWLSGRFLWLAPLNYTELMAKGYGLGYTVAYLSLSCGGRGFILAFISLVIQNIILLPALIFFSVIQLNVSLNKNKLNDLRYVYKQKRRLQQRELCVIITVVFVVIVCSVIDAYIIPHIAIELYKQWL